MTIATAYGAELFEHAPPRGVQSRLGLIKPGAPHIARRALLVALVGWAPLLLLAALDSSTSQAEGIRSLLVEAGVHARYLVAAPLLVLAEAQCAPRLSVIVNTFGDVGLVREEERGAFDQAVASTRRLLHSTAAEVAVLALAYLAVAAIVYSHYAVQIPAWHRTTGVLPLFSPAGWWHLLVSLPLLLCLILGWIWRLVLWTRLLWLMSRLDLRLVASHPDHAAGLSFVGHSVQAFAVVALALSAIPAGRSASVVLAGGGLPTPQLYFNLGLMATIMALLVAPLFVLTPTLIKAWRRGVFEYGALGSRLGHNFEHKWLSPEAPVDAGALEQPDFSATTDLYQVVSNVYAIRFVPIERRELITLAVAMLLPFVPVVLLAFPLDVIFAQIKRLLI